MVRHRRQGRSPAARLSRCQRRVGGSRYGDRNHHPCLMRTPSANCRRGSLVWQLSATPRLKSAAHCGDDGHWGRIERGTWEIRNSNLGASSDTPPPTAIGRGVSTTSCISTRSMNSPRTSTTATANLIWRAWWLTPYTTAMRKASTSTTCCGWPVRTMTRNDRHELHYEVRGSEA